MRYLGIVKRENGTFFMPGAFVQTKAPAAYEGVEVGGDILLLAAPLDQERMRRILELANRSIDEHRRTLERLA